MPMMLMMIGQSLAKSTLHLRASFDLHLPEQQPVVSSAWPAQRIAASLITAETTL